MDAGIKFPKTLSKSLNLFSIFLFVFGLLIIFLLNFSNLNIFNSAEASYRYGDCSGKCESGADCNKHGNPPVGKMFSCMGEMDENGEIVSYGCYAVDTNSTYPGRPDGDCYLDCETGWGDCGCDIDKCENECLEENKDKEPGTYSHTMDCDDCKQEFTCDCNIKEQREDRCPYSSTEALVRKQVIRYDPIVPEWLRSLNLFTGQNFHVGSFHNNSLDFVYDTYIEIYSGSNLIHSCWTSAKGCNDYLVTALIEGTYELRVKTLNKSGGFYAEPECNSKAFVYITDKEVIRAFDLTKNVVGKTSYYAGETVTFEVRITNTGDTAIDQMYFRDSFDSRYLQFIDIIGERYIGTNKLISSNLTPYVTPSLPVSNFIINDLTEPLGNLGINEYYLLTMTFKTKVVSENIQTCNYAIADDGYEQHDDQDCIDIIKPYTPPPTDK